MDTVLTIMPMVSRFSLEEDGRRLEVYLFVFILFCAYPGLPRLGPFSIAKDIEGLSLIHLCNLFSIVQYNYLFLKKNG